MNDLDPTPQPQGEPEPPESEAQWRWALREGWQLAKRRPQAWLMAVALSLGLVLPGPALGATLGLGKDGWGQSGLQLGLTFLVWVWSSVTFLRILAGELSGHPLTWRQSQAWSFARIRPCLSLWIRGIIMLAGCLLLTALALWGLGFRERVGEVMAVDRVAMQIAFLGWYALGARLANLPSYYVVQGAGFRSSLRLAWRESMSHWLSYLALMVLGSLPHLPFTVISTLSDTLTFEAQRSPWYFVSLGLGSLIAPWFGAAYLLLWLRNGEGTSLEDFGRTGSV